MKRLTLTEQTLFADLIQRCLDASFDEEFPENGSFTQQKRNGRAYWYYQGYEPEAGGEPAKRFAKYVGPVDDPDVAVRVESFRNVKSNYQERRKLVSMLRSAGLPRPPAVGGDLVEALWKGGLFRLRGVLVGTVAFQTYAGLLGFRFPESQIMTMDVDFAQFHSISALVADTIPPVLPALKAIDGTFRGVPATDGSAASTMFVNASGFRVDFLTPNEGSDDYADHPAEMPALGGAAAIPLRYLGFLIRDPVWSVILHKAGIPVRTPAPERFAIHKLIVSDVRKTDPGGVAKSRKDLQQADTLIAALGVARHHESLGDAWQEAWDTGPRWSHRLKQGASGLSDEARNSLTAGIEMVARRLSRKAETLGLDLLRAPG
jgi:hypothetical protein